MRLLLVDDDRDLVEVLTYVLQREGFSVVAAFDGEGAWRQFQSEQPSLVILDINMPGIDGLEVCRRIREASTVPVVMLTARADEVDIIRALGLGADDYVTKPFSPRQLVARVKAVLRRAAAVPVSVPPSEPEELRSGVLHLDLRTRTMTRRGEVIHLTPLEYKIMVFLLRNQGRVLGSAAIVEHVWGYVGSGNEDLVKVHVHRLRQKIEDDPQSPMHVRTVPGAGYIIPERGIDEPHVES
jgi:two-component system alkaline phosphatase synthesis response regulator PhoP